MVGRRGGLGVLLLVAVFVAVGVVAGPAWAVGVPGPAWAVKSVATPTVFSQEDNLSCEGGEEDCDAYEVTVTNVGTRPSTGRVVIRDTLPAGVHLPKTWSRP